MNEVQQFCRDHHPCEEGARFALRHKTLAAVWANCERGDWLWWMLRARGPVTKKLSVEVAIALAGHVLDIYESRPNSDDRPRNAIWAARGYLRSPSARTKKLAMAAAVAVAAVAVADVAMADVAMADVAMADAAYAAAAVAIADVAMADVAVADVAMADVAMADVADAAYAAAAVAAVAVAERKWQADKIRELVGSNPFV